MVISVILELIEIDSQKNRMTLRKDEWCDIPNMVMEMIMTCIDDAHISMTFNKQIDSLPVGSCMSCFRVRCY